jgi:DNA ligase (NAD+)
MSIADELAKEFLYHNDLYRAGRAIISDKHFDALKKALIDANPKHPALKKVDEGCVLSGLGTLPFAEWYSYLPKNTSVIVEPKIDGCAMAVRYVDGLLVKAWTRKGVDKTYCMRMIEDLPKHIIAKGTVDIRGELYGKGLIPARSQRLASGHLRKKQPSGMGLSFCAFQIFDGKGTEVSNLQQLVKWGFHVCGHIKVNTNVVNKVKQLHSQWQDSLIFSRYPTDGIVVKVLDKDLQEEIGRTSIAPSWATAIKDTWKKTW